ncbi:MAG TPA: hypothetical protein VL137_06345 [Polyangiaceae bacterium]|nr:hypothetical protein [Polyangiaceae bacterium]
MLRLLAVSEQCAQYDVELFEPEHSWSGRAEVSLSAGAVEFGGFSSQPPQWLSDLARTALRTLFRNHQTEGWPRRIARWRPAPNVGPL